MELKAENHVSTYIIQSQEEEIKRISLELHEGINQNLYSLSAGIEVLQSGIEQPYLKEYAQQLSELLNRTIQEVRLLSVELYPNTLTTLGLNAAIKSYAKLFTTTFGVLVHVSTTGIEHIMMEQKSMAVFRSCQEALLNIAKYADVSEAVVQIEWKERSLSVEIKDAGTGFDLQDAKNQDRLMGIAAMKQRLRIAGGDCLISSEAGKGTRVLLELPIQG
ncbi:sensor histidine kinase [Sediminibacillus massiliensis]|uniref:sensor histidine kinase n=1 Tax=Sediminibacillus massiliensis TaxID=1926277 RepID=UPI0009883556|nr:ATP-binding protein [Sediminibacillus massiliensis]